jgi:hypothetical protein
MIVFDEINSLNFMISKILIVCIFALDANFIC